jgi:hypothetical protein
VPASQERVTSLATFVASLAGNVFTAHPGATAWVIQVMFAAQPAEKLSVSSEINTKVNAPSAEEEVNGPGSSVPE